MVFYLTKLKFVLYFTEFVPSKKGKNMGKNIEPTNASTALSRLQEIAPGIVLKSFASLPGDGEDDEPQVVISPVVDPDKLEWAAVKVLKEVDETGEIPELVIGCYPQGRGSRVVIIVVEFDQEVSASL